MWPALRDLRRSFRRDTTRGDAMAGLVLGVEAVPDSLAFGLLAGVNPVSGVYAYLFGMAGGALFTSATFMAVQATGAMAMIVNDVDLGSGDDPARSLFTLSVVTGVVMIAAGVLRLGRLLRFVSKAVMTGFVTAIGINIVLGQLETFTGYDAAADHRVSRALELVTHFWRIDLAATAVGTLTILLVVVLQRTRLGALGLVLAVVVGSALAAVLDAAGADVLILDDLADVPRSLPSFTLPAFGEMPGLVIPAASLAFVGLVQGAAVSAGLPNPDRTYSDRSQDFIGQGAGNVASGLFQGMPVGGSMSASSLLVTAGARTRLSLLYAAIVMAIVVLVLGGLVGYVAMPALAGLLIVIGVGAVKPSQVLSVARTGPVALTVMSTTLVLTLLIPLQYAVLVGVGISLILFVAQQSNRLNIRQIELQPDGRLREGVPPDVVQPGTVVVLQPYGNIFFATVPMFEEQLPDVTAASVNSVVIIRIRGAEDIGSTLIEVLRRYAMSLSAVGSRLMLVTDSPRILRQLRVTGAERAIGPENIYRGTEWLGETVRRAYRDAWEWVQGDGGPGDRRSTQ